MLCGIKGAVEGVRSGTGRGVGLCVHSLPCRSLTQDNHLGLLNCSKKKLCFLVCGLLRVFGGVFLFVFLRMLFWAVLGAPRE